MQNAREYLCTNINDVHKYATSAVSMYCSTISYYELIKLKNSTPCKIARTCMFIYCTYKTIII